jgi:dGTPase
MTANMTWQQLLSAKRLGRASDPLSADVRSEFQRDFDRIVYSSAFRRMQDKTQVFPLAESDYVRTRLTHSIEVSSVGRSLGTLAGELISKKEGSTIAPPSEFGNVVAAACLAHDIGNPPFGHSGEDAIRCWFRGEGRSYLDGLSDAQRMDFESFEGNAQGFRILTKLQNPSNPGGLQLTYGTLSTFSKYPRRSVVDGITTPTNAGQKKFGFCCADEALFTEVAEGAGLPSTHSGAWTRHPLAYLMEAADDICYRVIDLEDGCRVGRVSFEEAERLLGPIAAPGKDLKTEKSYNDIADTRGQTEYLRARAINMLIYSVVKVFDMNYEQIMRGTFEGDLISHCAYAANIDAIKRCSKARIYNAPQVVQIEAAGFEVMAGLLEKFVPTLVQQAPDRSLAQQKLIELVPRQFRSPKSKYDALLAATDHVSGMTDSHAVSLFRRLKGIELPRS